MKLTKSAPFYAVLFDMDGVLLDSMPHHVQAWYESWHHHGIKVTKEDVLSLCGVPSLETTQTICHRYDRPFDQLFSEMVIRKKIQIKKSLDQDRPFGKAVDLAKHLFAKQVPMTVVSGSSRTNIAKNLDQYFPNIFPHFVSAQDTDRGKPFADPFLAGLKKLQSNESFLRAKHCLAIEDGLPGLESAKKAGMATIALATTLNLDQLKGKADFLAANHDQLFSLVLTLLNLE